MARRKKEKAELMETYKTKIRYKCPKRGWVEEEVEVKKFKEKEVPKETIDTSKIIGEPVEEHYSDETNYDDL